MEFDPAALAAECGLRFAVIPQQDPTAIEVFTALLGLDSLPADLARFYGYFRGADLGAVRLLAPGNPVGSAYDALAPSLDLSLIDRCLAVERLPGGAVAAAWPEGDGWAYGYVSVAGVRRATAASLVEYVQGRLRQEADALDAAVAQVNHAVCAQIEARQPNEYGVTTSTLPPTHWRVNRYCVQDEILAAWVVRYNRKLGSTDVRAVACDTVEQAGIHGGALAALTTLCADAYRSGGDPQLRFLNRAPTPLFRAAEDIGIHLTSPERLAADELREVLVAVVGLDALVDPGSVDLEQRAAIAIQMLQGLWSPAEVATLASFGSAALGVLIGGSSSGVVARQLDVDRLAAALLAGLAVRALCQPEDGDDLEDARRPSEIGAAPPPTGALWVLPEVELPVPPGWTLQAGDRGAAAGVGLAGGTVSVLVPRAVPPPHDIGDAHGLPDHLRRVFVVPADGARPADRCEVLVAPTTLPRLWRQAERRLRRMEQYRE